MVRIEEEKEASELKTSNQRNEQEYTTISAYKILGS
jgi:hypothetical protein